MASADSDPHGSPAGQASADQGEAVLVGRWRPTGLPWDHVLGGAARLPDRLRQRALSRSRDDDVLTEIRTPSRLVSAGPRRVTKIVLFPVRFLFTAQTGQVGTNTLAARHYLASPDAPATSLVAAALAWRLEPPADGEAAALLGRELVPLYVHYIDDHIARLRAVGHHRLADRFHRWRTRLLA